MKSLRRFRKRERERDDKSCKGGVAAKVVRAEVPLSYKMGPFVTQMMS